MLLLEPSAERVGWNVPLLNPAMAVQEPPEQRVGWNVALDVLIQQRQIHRAQASPCLPSRLRLPPVTVDAAQNRTMGADGHRRAIPSGLCRYLDAVQLSQRGRS